MWKLPSPSVICAQNSPVIFTSGFTRVRSTSMESILSRADFSAFEIILAPHVLVPFAEHVGGVAQNLVALEFRLGPVGRALLDLERVAILQVLTASRRPPRGRRGRFRPGALRRDESGR